MKIAVLMNETTGTLPKNLHLNAGTTPTFAKERTTIMEYCRTTTALWCPRPQQHSSSAVGTSLVGGPATMDVGATYKGKGKGRGKNKGKR